MHASTSRAAAPTRLLLTALVMTLLGVGWSAPAVADGSDGTPATRRVDAAQLVSGYGHSCAIVGRGQVRCWGWNVYGQLGQGNTHDIGDDAGESSVPVDLGSGRTAVALSAGGAHTCAITDTGQLRCWGLNEDGQLGQGHTDNIGDSPGETTVPVDLGGRTAVALSTGVAHTCAVLDTGQLRCWGANSTGQLGQGSTAAIGDDPGETTAAVDLGPGRTAIAVSAGSDGHTCAILDTGQLRCWGWNARGQLGQGHTAAIGDDPGETTAAVDLGGRSAVAVSTGGAHTCAVLDTGQLRCWGWNGDGQLGQGHAADVGDQAGETTAALHLDGRTAVAVTAGGAHTCAVLDSGQLRCWGHNGYGQLGQGSADDVGDNPGETTAPVDLGPGAVALAVSGGGRFTCAALGDLTVRCWGDNTFAQLGQPALDSSYGDAPGETPAALPAILLGGHRFGRDTDGDGLRDAVDACPTRPAATATGCPPPAAPPVPEAVLKGRKVLLHTVLSRKEPSARCPHKAAIKVTTRGQQGRIRLTRQLTIRTVPTGCLVHGKVRLPAKPKRTAKVKVTVTGARLQTKHLLALRM